MSILEQISDLRSRLESINLVLQGISCKTNEMVSCMGLVGTDTYNKVLQFQATLNNEAIIMQQMLADLYTKIDNTRDVLLGLPSPVVDTVISPVDTINSSEKIEESVNSMDMKSNPKMMKKMMDKMMLDPEMKKMIDEMDPSMSMEEKMSECKKDPSMKKKMDKMMQDIGSEEEAKLSGVDTYIVDDILEELQDILDDASEYPGLYKYITPVQEMINSLSLTTDSKKLDTLIPQAMQIIEDSEALMNLCDQQQPTNDMGTENTTEQSDVSSKKPSDYLVVEDRTKSTTWHLQVKRNGKPDHQLMGAAWAALHQGHMGNKYEGPKKDEALRKLKALYKKEKMPLPTE